MTSLVVDEISRSRDIRQVEKLWGGYGSIERVYLAQKTVIVKRIAPPPDDGSVSHARKVRSYQVERTFYEKYSGECACRVARYEGGDESRLVLEDLDASGYAGRASTLGTAAVAPLVEWLARFHKTFLGRAPDGLWEEGCYWHLDTRPDELAAMDRSDPLFRSARDLDAKLKAAEHRTIVHGDAKVANFCFGPDGVAALDFQYVGGGIGVRDLAYLLGSCWSEKQLASSADETLDLYFRHLDGGPDLEREWRALWPVCFADFDRFLKGWCPGGHWKRNTYTSRLAQLAIASL
ncbi:hypothetical protein CTAYLR_000356 [Chrysophaeum taylorii]|uniref:Aminoglycoside phosphotransferase domain-containing protein n=1 Tax=Chrysophaeum taylorii TaxID=2483200 RepID=A0AAD7XN16_9STRA|nr:hypothetical protein CTAYLR_000356 [Chrysophaeum taylorii]